jgi:hypothetical protein
MVKLYVGLYVKYRLLLADCNETGIFIFSRKILKYKIFMKIRPVTAELILADGRKKMPSYKLHFPNLRNRLKRDKVYMAVDTF